MLTLLARVDEPEQVLAITFTRKAAAEMRHRVVAALARAASGEPAANDYEAEGLALARAALERDAVRGWRLLDDPGRLAMRTIDSLATALAHRLPMVSALGAAVGTVDDPRALHLEAAERFLDHHLASIERVCLQRDNRLDQVRDLLADLLAVRDQWQGYVQEDLGDERLRELLQRMLDGVVRARLEAVRASAPADLAARLEAPLRRAAELLLARAALEGGALDELPARIVALAGRAGALPSVEPEDAGDWRTLADFLLTGGGAPRKRLDKSSGFPAQGEAKALGTTKEALAAHKASLEPLLADLAEAPLFVARLLEARALGELAYGDEDWALLGQLADGLRVLLAELQLVFAARREVDFIEISARARRALGDEEHPTDLALSMDLRVQHLLVDEFQDSSHSQLALFERLVAGWSPGDGRSFFAVGDPMQSIYRFREGDVGLFLRAIDEGIGPLPLDYLRLRVNFRSVAGVIDWINAGFGAAFPARPDRDIGAVTYEPSSAHLDGAGEVRLHALVRGDDAARREGEHVAALVAQALAEDPGQSIGVLVRARSHASEVVAALHARGIAFRAIELDRLGERPVVHDLVALAHALCFPHDRISWLALLRGPLCGLVLDDLHALVESSEQRPLIDLLHDPSRLAALSPDGRGRVARFLAAMEPAVERAPRGTVVPWLEAIWLSLGGPAACADAADLEAAERCIARLATLEQEGSLRRRRTVEAAMARLFAEGATDPAARVQLMTLHKSKGLEFDTVILPALARPGQADRSRLMEWFRTDGEDGPRLLLAPIDPVGAPASLRNPVGQLLKGFRDRAAEAERLRLFYVACTRARRRLHLLASLPADEAGRPKPPASGSLLAPLWPTLGAHCRFVDEGAAAEEHVERETRRAPPLRPAGLRLDAARAVALRLDGASAGGAGGGLGRLRLARHHRARRRHRGAPRAAAARRAARRRTARARQRGPGAHRARAPHARRRRGAARRGDRSGGRGDPQHPRRRARALAARRRPRRGALRMGAERAGAARRTLRGRAPDHHRPELRRRRGHALGRRLQDRIARGRRPGRLSRSGARPLRRAARRLRRGALPPRRATAAPRAVVPDGARLARAPRGDARVPCASMKASYWQEKWAADRIGFHQERVNKRLEEHWGALDVAPGAPVFVPLCGKSLDMLWLHERGHPVLGIELVEKAVLAFFEENGLAFERRADGPFERVSGTGSAAGIELLVGDFFALSATDLARVGAFYDRASLIAMDDAFRARYAHHLGNVVAADVAGLLLAIDYEQARMQGPPFAVPDAVVQDLLGDAFDIETLAHYSGPERLGNLAERGLDTLDERVYRLRRRAR